MFGTACGLIWMLCVLADADLERVTMPMAKSSSSQHDESLGLSTTASSTIYKYIGWCNALAAFSFSLCLVPVCLLCLIWRFLMFSCQPVYQAQASVIAQGIAESSW